MSQVNLRVVKIKSLRLIELGAPAIPALCEMCQDEPGTEMHHVVNKGMTNGNSFSRSLSEVKELMVLLGRRCHSNAHNPSQRDQCLRILIKRYGRFRVAYALSRVVEASHGNVRIVLPEDTA